MTTPHKDKVQMADTGLTWIGVTRKPDRVEIMCPSCGASKLVSREKFAASRYYHLADGSVAEGEKRGPLD